MAKKPTGARGRAVMRPRRGVSVALRDQAPAEEVVSGYGAGSG